MNTYRPKNIRTENNETDNIPATKATEKLFKFFLGVFIISSIISLIVLLGAIDTNAKTIALSILITSIMGAFSVPIILVICEISKNINATRNKANNIFYAIKFITNAFKNDNFSPPNANYDSNKNSDTSDLP